MVVKWNLVTVRSFTPLNKGGAIVNQIIYIVGLVVIVLAVLAFFGLR